MKKYSIKRIARIILEYIGTFYMVETVLYVGSGGLSADTIWLALIMSFLLIVMDNAE